MDTTKLEEDQEDRLREKMDAIYLEIKMQQKEDQEDSPMIKGLREELASLHSEMRIWEQQKERRWIKQFKELRKLIPHPQNYRYHGPM